MSRREVLSARIADAIRRPYVHARVETGEGVISAAIVVLIMAILLVILGNIAMHGAKMLTWEFISQPPRDGLTAGGILPAIVGTGRGTELLRDGQEVTVSCAEGDMGHVYGGCSRST